MANFTAVAAAG